MLAKTYKHWKTHVCFLQLNYNHICLSKKLQHLTHFVWVNITLKGVHRWLLHFGMVFVIFCCHFRPIPTSQLEVFCVKTLFKTPLWLLLHLRGQFKLQHSLFCNYEALHGFTICVWLPGPSCWILTFSYTKNQGCLDCLEPKTAQLVMWHHNQHFSSGGCGMDEMHQSFLFIPTVAYFRMLLFFWILYMCFLLHKGHVAK